MKVTPARAALIVGGAAAAWSVRGWIRCLFRGHPGPVRHPLGGFACLRCGKKGASLEDFGFKGGGYVDRLRTRGW